MQMTKRHRPRLERRVEVRGLCRDEQAADEGPGGLGSKAASFGPVSKTFLVAFSLLLVLMPPGEAQEWEGSGGAAYLWQSTDGSLDSFQSQTNLSDGFMLEDLSLLYRDSDGAVSDFKLHAWGFGDANPAEAARLELRLASGYLLRLDYDRRESFFYLAGGDLALRADSWDITRFRGELIIDAWRPLEISLSYRTVRRDGTVHRPNYGLNELYPVRFDLDETLNEATLRLVTRTLPVRLVLEQSLADLERRNRPFPAGDSAIGVPDPDLLDGVGSTLVQRVDGEPTTRLVASYSNRSFEGVASLLWRSSDLGISGSASQRYLIGGGDIGTMELVDDVLGSAQHDAFSGALALGFALAPRWSLRRHGDHRDGSTDSTLLTERLLRVVNPAGDATEWGATFDDKGMLDFQDSSARLTLEYRADTWALWAGGGAASREVSWGTSDDQMPYEAKRDASGFLAGGSWKMGRRLDLSLELQRGDFDEHVFRTDPETVDRATLRLRSELGRGWQLALHGRYLSAQQENGGADLDMTSTTFGVACTWSSPDGRSTAGLDLERYSLTTDTLLVLPGGAPGRSRYDLDLTTMTLFGHTRAGRVGVSGSLTYLSDDGDTFPVDAWNGSVRVTLYGSGSLEYSALAQLWSYDEALADLDDFDVLRYGLAVTWRFE